MLSLYNSIDNGFIYLQNNYLEILDSVESINLKEDGYFNITLLYDIKQNYKNFDNFNENIVNSIPMFRKNIMSISLLIIEANHIKKQAHIDSSLNGKLKRYHLVLKTNDSTVLYIREEGFKYDKNIWLTGKWFDFEGIDKIHYPENTSSDDTIILVVDVLESELTEEIIEEYYEKVYKVTGYDF